MTRSWTDTEALGTDHRKAHNMLESLVINVKDADYGAVGDGVTDDTTAIQNAVNAAGTFGTPCNVYFPAGDYLLSGIITLPTTNIRLSGASNRNQEGTFGTGTGTRIYGDLANPLFNKDTENNEAWVIFEDLAIWNTNNAGTGIYLEGLGSGSGLYRCGVKAQTGVYLGANTHDAMIMHCNIDGYGPSATSIGVTVTGHTQIIDSDFQGLGKGIYMAGVGCSVVGCRIEVCTIGIDVNTALGTRGTNITGCYFEANDTSIKLNANAGAFIGGCNILGSVGSPSGGSIYGLRIGEATRDTVVVGVHENGSHSTAFIRVHGAVGDTLGLDGPLTFISCNGTSGWTLPGDASYVEIINCTGTTNIVRAPVVATGSLPAAGTSQNGRIIIEDVGAGDRNLIIYAGGERFRIDGGAAV